MRTPIVALLLLALSSTYVHADTQKPSAVNNVQASAASPNSIHITWNHAWDNVGVHGYNIYRNGSYYKTVFGTSNFLDTYLGSNTRYEYSVVAFDKAQNFSAQSSKSAAYISSSGSGTTQTTQNGTPSTPTGLSGAVLNSSQVKLQWTPPANAVTGYNIYRNGSYHMTVKNRNDYTASSLSSGQTYRWQITSFVGNKYSLKSSEISTTTNSSQSTPPPPSNPSTQGSVPSGMRLVFSEDFQSNDVNASKWQSRYRWGPWWTINNEQQFYVDRVNEPSFGHSPFEFDGNHMTINAIRTPSHLLSKANNKNYLSGVLTTYGKFKMRYGYVEMRAKLPRGKGLWPAFWLLHNDEKGNRPEIDVVEMLGKETDRVYQTYHYYQNGSLKSTPSYKVWGSDFAQDFHTYGMKWEPGRITWYVDGNVTNTFSSGNVPSEEMYLLVNLAVGGNWAGSPDGTTPFPARFTIDYIRAYQY